MEGDEPVNGEPAPTPANAGEGEADGSFAGLDDLQVKAVLALLHEPMITRAATTVGVHERTLRRWLAEPAFKHAYHAAKREAFSHAIGLTQRYAPVAVTTLVKVMTDPKTTPGVKVSAATGLLKFGREGIELDELAERLEALEKASQRAVGGWKNG